MDGHSEKQVLTRRAVASIFVGSLAVALLPRASRAETDVVISNTLIVTFSGGINNASIGNLEKALFTVKDQAEDKGILDKSATILLIMNSRGGNIEAGMEMYNLIRAFPIKCTTYNISEVASAATLIYLAGSRRLCARNAKFLVHSETFDDEIKQANRGHYREIEEEMNIDTQHMIELYVERTKLKIDDVTKMVNEGVWIDSDVALKQGITTDNNHDLPIPSDPCITYHVWT